MVAAMAQCGRPFNLVVTGQAESWLPALEQIVGPRFLVPRKVGSDRELLNVVSQGQADAAVLDDAVQWQLDVLQLLRLIRRVDRILPVLVVTRRRDRRWLEDALRLAAFSVVTRPLELEELLRQVARMMRRLEELLRDDI